MGSTSIYDHNYQYKNFKTNKDIRHYFDDLWNEETDTVKHTVLRSSVINTVYYAAIKQIRKDTNETEVFASIIPFSLSRHELTYSDYTDANLPYYTKCPEATLKLLSPTNNQSANKWRKRCHEYNQMKRLIGHAKRKNIPIAVNGLHDTDNPIKVCYEQNYHRWVETENPRYYITESTMMRRGFKLVNNEKEND